MNHYGWATAQESGFNFELVGLIVIAIFLWRMIAR